MGKKKKDKSSEPLDLEQEFPLEKEDGEFTGLKDMLNREIRVGDVIAYATRKSSSTFMNMAHVVGYSETKSRWNGRVNKNLRIVKLATTGYLWSGSKEGAYTATIDLGRAVITGMRPEQVGKQKPDW